MKKRFNELSENEIAAIKRDYLAGFSKAMLRRLYSISYATLEKVIADLPKVKVSHKKRSERQVPEELEPEILEYFLAPHSLRETGKKFNCSCNAVRRIVFKYGYSMHSKEVSIKLRTEHIKQTSLERYGVPNPLCAGTAAREKQQQTMFRKFGATNFLASEVGREAIFAAQRAKYDGKIALQDPGVRDKIKQSMIARFGVDNPLKSEEIKQKQQQTNLTRYGVKFIAQVPEFLHKSFETKKRELTFISSKPEEYFYEFLCQRFGKDDVVRQYEDPKRYPFNCDFYIKSADTFIELNLIWTHGLHPFDPTSEEDKKKLAFWEQRSASSKYYRTAIKVWTESDPLKFTYAKQNSLNYIVFYTEKEVREFMSNANSIKAVSI